MSDMSDVTKDLLRTKIASMRTVVQRAKQDFTEWVKNRTRGSSIKYDTITGVYNKPSSTEDKRARKKENLLKELQEIDSLVPDEVSKFALINDKPRGYFMRDSSISDKDRAMIRLADNKYLQYEVEKFRERFPKWKVQVPSIYIMWDYLNHARIKSSLLQKAVGIDIHKVSEPVECAADKFIEPQVDGSESKLEPKEKNKSAESILESKEKNKSAESRLEPKEKNKSAQSACEKAPLVKNKTKNTAKNQQVKTNCSGIDNLCVVQKTITASSVESKKKSKNAENDHCDENIAGSSEILSELKTANGSKNIKQSVNMKKEEKVKVDEMIVKKLDLTACDQDEFFIDTIKPNQDADPDNSSSRVKFISFFVNSDGEEGSDDKDFSSKSQVQNRDPNAPNRYERRKHLRAKWMELYANHDYRKDSESEEYIKSLSKEKRHRSWDGRTKWGAEIKSIIANQGGMKRKRYTPANAQDGVNALSNAKKMVVEEKLHPSWEAKRKLVEQSKNIAAYQGKKIKFDDDD